AAITAAQRGHHVALYEQESRLGGQFNLAAMAPHKEEFLDVIHYQTLMARRAGVNIHLNTKVTPEMLIANQPEVVILASGGVPSIVVDQALDLTYGWGNAPEIIELSWSTVELGSIDPLGPPGWVALIRLHQQGDEQLPNINLLVEIPDRELMLEIIESLHPATE
ncbi:MAG: FAD/NAD(P)-binding oxidoreductase, partial [Anaerolineales bacterium]